MIPAFIFNTVWSLRQISLNQSAKEPKKNHFLLASDMSERVTPPPLCSPPLASTLYPPPQEPGPVAVPGGALPRWRSPTMPWRTSGSAGRAWLQSSTPESYDAPKPASRPPTTCRGFPSLGPAPPCRQGVDRRPGPATGGPWQCEAERRPRQPARGGLDVRRYAETSGGGGGGVPQRHAAAGPAMAWGNGWK